jgi:spoIIIJ-associated protein
MEERIYEGKEQKEVLASALEELNLTENDVMYYFSKEKAGLLKKEVIKLHLFEVKDVAEFIKEFLTQTTKDMGLDVQFESSIRDKQISIKMYSDNNSILIGHEGKTLKALTTVIKQVVYNKVGEYPYLLLDVENYKAKQEKYLIRLAKNIAKEVGHTKVEVELEDMNSYERRIIHNALTDNKYVYTESTGVEPHRHIVIKPKEQ